MVMRMTEIEYVEYIRRCAQGYIDAIVDKKLGAYVDESNQLRSWENCREHLAASTVINLCGAWDCRSRHVQYIKAVEEIAKTYLCNSDGDVNSAYSREWQECRMSIDPVILVVMCDNWIAREENV